MNKQYMRCTCGFYSEFDGTENFCGGCGVALLKPLEQISYVCPKCGPITTGEYKATPEFSVNFCGRCGTSLSL